MPRIVKGADIVSPLRSAELRRLEIIVRLDDLDEAVLGRAVSAVRIRMMALHQFLEARLDLDRGRIDLEPERIERLAFGVVHRARFLRRAFARPRARAAG